MGQEEITEDTAALFFVEFLSDWGDYSPEWLREDDDVYFATAEEAQAHIDEMLDANYAHRLGEWEKKVAKLAPLRALYVQRRQLLIDHDLWRKPEESFIPLVGVPSDGPKPERGGDAWRVRSAAPSASSAAGLEGSPT